MSKVLCDEEVAAVATLLEWIDNCSDSYFEPEDKEALKLIKACFKPEMTVAKAQAELDRARKNLQAVEAELHLARRALTETSK